MARSDSGVPYFPLDVSLDEKFELIEAEFGLIGFAVVVKLFQRIYGGQGYYCEWTNEVALLFEKNACGIVRKPGSSGGVVSEIVSASIRRGIFDKGMFEKYHVLTSEGIQKRYFEIVKRRKNIKVKKEYLLISAPNFSEDADISGENVDISSENADISAQRKVEESKTKEIKGNTYVVPAEIAKEWTAFVEMRKKIKAPMTEYAIKLALDKLEKLAPKDYGRQRMILDQSTSNCWKGLFPLKSGGRVRAQKPAGQPSYNLADIDAAVEKGIL